MDWLSLSILVLAPVVVALLILLPSFPNHEVLIRRFTKGFGFCHFIYSLLFLVSYNFAQSGFQFNEELLFFNKSFIEPLGIRFFLGIDGISLLLIVLTSFLTLMALFASKSNITHKHKLYYSLVLMLETAILGVFSARDLFLFFMFWELELIPMYFLISIWGSGRKHYSAMKFVLYTFFGSLFMLFAMLALYGYNFTSTGKLSMDIASLSAVSYPTWIEILAFVGFFIAFAVKLPVVPFHTWLPDAHVDAPTPISMLLAGILLKMGAYGLIRINLGILGDSFKIFAPVFILLGTVNIIYTAIIAYAQKDLKKLVAYSSVSHMGVVLLGLGALNFLGISGAVFQILAHGIISAGLFMAVGIIYLRTHTREIDKLGGIANVMPQTYYYTLIIALAGLGLPLLMGFPAEMMVFWGAFSSSITENLKIIVIIAISGIFITAAYILKMIHGVFCENMFETHKKLQDMTPHEIIVMLSLICTIVLFGVYPMGLIKYFSADVANLLSHIK